MRTPFALRALQAAGVGLWLGLSTVCPLTAAETPADSAKRHPEGASEAPRLVQAALDAELAGDAAKRAALLADALQADPDFAPAHWQKGQVKFRGAWRTPADVQKLVSADPTFAEYRELRDSLPNGLDSHIQLAQWCREKNLENEERYHWANVVLAQPDHAEARERLGLIVYHDRLFTREQVAEFERSTKDAESNLRRFQPQFIRLCRDATSGDAGRRAAALSGLRAVNDAAAIPALEAAVRKAMEKSPKFSLDLHLALVAALSHMPQHESTLRLVNHAVYAPEEAVRKAAAQALKSRPQTDYVPLLMAAMRAPVDVEIDVLATSDGSVRLSETFVQDGPDADAKHVRNTSFLTQGAIGHDPARSNPAAVLSGNLAKAAAIADESRARAEAANADAELLNERIADVLRISVGAELDNNPEGWWSEWTAYNELQTPAFEPEVATREDRSFVYFYPQAPIMHRRQPSNAKLQGRSEGGNFSRDIHSEMTSEAVRGARFATPTYSVTNYSPPPSRRSCFVPGTPVWTQAGPVAIEKIALGDMVLTQNPWTGEIAYRPVLDVTVGQPAPVINLQLRDEAIGTTLGHRFWVTGRGWQMAKFLEPAAPLHALGGAVAIESIAKADKAACYNLVVDEFHTYFVGKSQLLVHDFTCPWPVLASLPGSATPRLESPASTPAAP